MTQTLDTLPDLAPAGETLRTKRLPAGFVVPAVGVALVAVVAVAGPWLVPADAMRQNLSATLQDPSWSHPLGTDYLGRDVLAGTIAGGRTALVGPLLITLGVTFLGNVIGVTAGYFGGWVDAALMRTVDVLYALPGLLVAIVVVGVLGGSQNWTILMLIILLAPADARIIRGATLVLGTMPYVEAVETIGISRLRIMAVHIWPNLLSITLAQAFLTFPAALITLSSLSFLGLGVPPGSVDWGRAMADGRPYIFTSPLSVLAPAFMIVLSATSTNLLGDWVQARFGERGRG